MNGKLLFAAWAAVVALTGLVGFGTARADEGTDKNQEKGAVTWAVLDDKGKTLGTEMIRIVRHPDGAVFASGEAKVGPKGKKRVIRTHVQRRADGALVKYQRTEGGLKGSGIRYFEFEGRTRFAPVNAPGKAADVEGPIQGAILDPGAWHLLALWKWPGECKKGATLTFHDASRQKNGSADIACTGSDKVLNPKKEQVPVQIWTVAGVAAAPVSVYVARGGQVVGIRGDKQQLLLNGWAWQGGAAVADDTNDDADEEEKEIKERGAGP